MVPMKVAVDCCCSVSKSCLSLCYPMHCSPQASLSVTISQSLFKFIPIESVMLSNHLTVRCPLLLLPSIFPSIKVFSNESSLRIRWPKYWSFSFSISPSSQCSGLISLGLTSLISLQSRVLSLLPYMIPGKAIALTILTFVGKVLSLLFNILSRFVIAFLPESKCLNLIAAVTIHSDFGAQENKTCHCFHSPPLLFAMK